MQIRTLSALLVWAVVLLLLLNAYFRTIWIFYAAVALIVIAVLVYFSANLRKRFRSRMNSS